MNIHDAYNGVYDSLGHVLSGAQQSMKLMSSRHQQVAPYLNKYMEHMAMSGHFFSSAHKENNYEEASGHLEDIQKALAAMHQVSHYQTGKNSALTQVYSATIPKFTTAADNYRMATSTRSPELGRNFEEIMKKSNVNPKQFD